MHAPVTRRWSGRSVVLLAVTLIVAAHAGHWVFERAVVDRVERETTRLEQRAIVSLVQLGRLAADLKEERILLDDHIHSTGGAQMRDIERQIAATDADLKQAIAVYEPVVSLPYELEEWQAAKAGVADFTSGLDAFLALSRDNRDEEALAQIAVARSRFTRLDAAMETLVHINQRGAVDSISTRESMRETAKLTVFGANLVQFCVLLLLCGWALSRVRRYERDIEAQNHELDAFAGRVAHDLRNALGPIMMSGSLLAKGADDPGFVRTLAARIQRSMRRSMSLIHALLAFARQTDQLRSVARASVAEAVKAAVDEVTPLAHDVGVEIGFDTSPDAHVRCDPDLLHVVTSNLVNNAVKFLKGRDRRQVFVGTTRANGWCTIEVTDTGPGIPPESQERIFDPFYRVPGNRADGLGIGLATVRRIIAASGGSISVESVVGQGTTFTVRLPEAAAVSLPAASPPPPMHVSGPVSSARN